MAKVVSKLSEPLYEQRWQDIHASGGLGLTIWARFLDDWLVEVAKRMGSPNKIVREANETGNSLLVKKP